MGIIDQDYRIEKERVAAGARPFLPLIAAPDTTKVSVVNVIKPSADMLAIWRRQLWPVPWSRSFMPDVALMYEVFDHFDIGELVSIAALNRFHIGVVRKYLRQRFGIMVGRFFKNPQAFGDMLEECQAVVSGAAALHLMLPAKTTHWTPRILDILVPSLRYLTLHHHLEHLGFAVVCHDRDIPPQPSHIYSCPLAVQTSPEHSLTKPEPIPGLPDPSLAFPNSSAAFPKGCCTDVCLVSIPEAVNTIPEHI